MPFEWTKKTYKFFHGIWVWSFGAKQLWHLPMPISSLAHQAIVMMTPTKRNGSKSEPLTGRHSFENHCIKPSCNIPKDIADSIPLIPVGYNKATLYFPNPGSFHVMLTGILALFLLSTRNWVMMLWLSL